MTKAQIHFSNALEQFIPILKEKLFSPHSAPFDKRLVVVPHLGLKDYLMQNLAKDPQLQVAAGMQIVGLSEAWSKITKKKLPTALELSLLLQHELLPLIDEERELKHYFKTAAREKRIGPFCDTLAAFFLRYAVYGKKKLSPWQERLWKKLKWTTPIDELNLRSNWQIHLFGFSFLPQSLFHFFQKLDAQFYVFSPCEIYWGDFYSEKQRGFLGKALSEQQLNFFEASFEDQNPFLASFGKVGRKMLFQIEESNLPTEDFYVEGMQKSCLQHLQQDCLKGTFSTYTADLSLRVLSATTPLREVEILKDGLLQLFDEKGIVPKEVQVFAPNISLYAPYIHAVFGDIAYTISDLEFVQVDEIGKAFSKLIELPKKRFALEEVLQVLSVMSKFSFDIGKIEKWLKAANIRWGFSRQQRETFFLQDLEKEQLVSNPEEGTWEKGLKRLLLGLGHLEGEEAPLCAIEATEMEQFDLLYTVLHALADDLSPFYDGTKWTIPTWARYFACLLESYFAIEPSHELYKQLLKLGSACDQLDRQEFSYPSIERILAFFLEKKSKTHHSPHLQAVHFGSLSEGCIQPSKVICLLGMQEEAFPRKEENASLYPGERDFRPKQHELDRYLFLQALLSARDYFLASYIREEGGKTESSFVLQELLSHIENGKIEHHPSHPCDPKYFQGEWKSYSQEHYKIAVETQHPQQRKPLFPEFYEKRMLAASNLEKKDIDIQKLFKFSRHPLRYYFHEILGFYPQVSSQIDNQEYLLDRLTKRQLVKKALFHPLEQVLKEADKRGELPTNLLNPLAKQQIKADVELWEMALEEFGISKHEIIDKKIEIQEEGIQLEGKLEFFTSKGLLIWGENCLEDRIQHWASALVMQRLGLPILFIKDQTQWRLEASLEKYLEYHLLASKHPSPLSPSLAKALLQGTPDDLKKQLKQVEDEIWSWLLFRDPMPSSHAIHSNWHGILTDVFEGADATV